jgi:FkbM family methyltransferase
VTILDVGANTGQFAESIFQNYDCRIISFEPMKFEYDQINDKASKNPKWSALNIGLGDKNETVKINISKNSYSSSILDLNDETLKYDSDIGYIDRQEIVIKRLDSIWDTLAINGEKTLLKIDTQGYESKVLDGSSAVLNYISGIQIELSVVQLYKNEPLFDEMHKKINQLGFDLYAVEPGYKDPVSGKLLQIEAVFFKSE